MNYWLVSGGVIALLTAAVHSTIGELLIFRHMRSGGIVPDLALPPLPQRRTGILWTTWHITSVFGIAFAAMLFAAAWRPVERLDTTFMIGAIAFANLGASLLVLAGTRGRHPGWVALLAVAVLTGTASLID